LHLSQPSLPFLQPLLGVSSFPPISSSPPPSSVYSPFFAKRSPQAHRCCCPMSFNFSFLPPHFPRCFLRLFFFSLAPKCSVDSNGRCPLGVTPSSQIFFLLLGFSQLFPSANYSSLPLSVSRPPLGRELSQKRPPDSAPSVPFSLSTQLSLPQESSPRRDPPKSSILSRCLHALFFLISYYPYPFIILLRTRFLTRSCRPKTSKAFLTPPAPQSPTPRKARPAGTNSGWDRRY